MADKLVLVAGFYSPVEAQLARGLLETEGIRTFLTGEQAGTVFGVQGLGGQTRLQVGETDAQRALEILAPHLDHPADDDEFQGDTDSWLCPLCGDAVREDLDFCPDCDTPRPEVRKSDAVTTAPRRGLISQDIQEEPAFTPNKITADEPHETGPSALDDDLDVPDMETLVGDDLVRRAFLSALFSIAFPPLILYSLWLLARLLFYTGKVSPRLIPRFYWAIALALFCPLLFLAVFMMQARFR